MGAPFDWHMPVLLRFGAGCSTAVPAALGARRAVVMAFEPAAALGIEADWRAVFGERLLDWVAVPEGLATLTRAQALSARVWRALDTTPGAVLIGLGGGTVLDLAKLLRCRPADLGHEAGFEALVAALRGAAPWPCLQLAPLWLLPTTAGTGAEVTRWATIWDTTTRAAIKRSFDEAFGWADRAYVDPALTLSCPPDVTRDTALDALAHALESIWNRHANPVSDTLAISAARRVVAALPQVLAVPRDLAARTELSLAALEAGIAFSQTRTAIAHALSYEVTLEQGLPHGRAVALWLPLAWRLAAGANAAIDARLAQVFGVPTAEGAEWLADWLHDLGVVTDPALLGIADADARVAAALHSPRGRNFITSAAAK